MSLEQQTDFEMNKINRGTLDLDLSLGTTIVVAFAIFDNVQLELQR